MQVPSNGNSPAMTSDDLTLVMGAGPGGLCSAYVLSKAGKSALVVEKAPFVGGLARTIRRETDFGEFRFDIGGHRWFTKVDELNDIFKEVVAEELLWVNRVSRIYFDGRYVDYPLKISNALKAIGPVTATKAVPRSQSIESQRDHIDGGCVHRPVRHDTV
jgi:protoporphyrinogen oxidase